MTDVRLYNEPDGGEITCTDGIVEMDGGLETSVFLSLFGGEFWGNLSETDKARHISSETQRILDGLPAIPDNLRRIEDAVKRDLAWMIPDAARTVDATARLVAPKRVEIAIVINGDQSLKFVENWRAAE